MKDFSGERPGYDLRKLSPGLDDIDLRTGLARALPLDLPQTFVFKPADQARGTVYERFGKRLFDLMLVALSLPIALPFIAICAAALWLEGGQPFYRQDRLGRGGKVFSILKLRTMVRDADDVLEQMLASDPDMRREWNKLQKIKNDPRVTRVGRFLRATSLDELPQFWNVIKGDMSLVGPRPMMLDQLPMYGDPTAYFAQRPGITGLWQVSARNGNTFCYRNQVDAEYDSGVSLVRDGKILMRTISVVLRRTGY